MIIYNNEYLNDFAFIFKGGIISSIEHLIEIKNVKNIKYDKEKAIIRYFFGRKNSMYHSLEIAYFFMAAENYPEIFKIKNLNYENFFEKKCEIDNIRKSMRFENIKNIQWENLIYVDDIQLKFNKNLEYNLNILKEYLNVKYQVNNEVDNLLNNAWNRFFDYPYMKNYVIPSIERYEYWRSLYKGKKTFYESYKDYQN